MDAWSLDEDRIFEKALAQCDGPNEAVWQKIAAMLPLKCPESVKKRYLQLEEDIRNIEAGRVSLPHYGSGRDPDEGPSLREPSGRTAAQSGALERKGGAKGQAPRAQNGDQERRKGVPWTEEEHKLFLQGLTKFGKGDWRSISRTYVISRTPTQVASHAQKYFIRLNSMNRKDKRRSSIHDITSASGGLAAERAAAAAAKAAAAEEAADMLHGHGSLGVFGHHGGSGLLSHSGY